MCASKVTVYAEQNNKRPRSRIVLFWEGKVREYEINIDFDIPLSLSEVREHARTLGEKYKALAYAVILPGLSGTHIFDPVFLLVENGRYCIVGVVPFCRNRNCAHCGLIEELILEVCSIEASSTNYWHQIEFHLVAVTNDQMGFGNDSADLPKQLS